MPESVRNRPTVSHEYLFLLSASRRYFFDQDAIAEPLADASAHAYARPNREDRKWKIDEDRRFGKRSANRLWSDEEARKRAILRGRNARSVWRIPPEPYHGAHYAVMPSMLAEKMVLSTTPEDVCSVCAQPWVRRKGRSCPSCAAPIPWNGKRCETCGEANLNWRGEREVVPDLRSGDGNGREVPRRDPKPTTTLDLGYGPTCDCAGERIGGTVLDPFSGSGTTGVAAIRRGRRFLGIDAGGENEELARKRLSETTPPLVQGVREDETQPEVEEAMEVDGPALPFAEEVPNAGTG
jgi:hypothetical protein